jgi:NodT family efflux transporter outer membrane factor (OMF) lipoprotein
VNKLRFALLLAGLCSLAACKTVGPDYHLPAAAAINRPGAQKAFIDIQQTRGIDASRPAPDAWWQLYDDSLLNDLIGKALASNAGLRVASANLARASAIYNEAQHTGGFDYGANLSVSRGLIPAESLLLTKRLPVFNLASGGVSASYEFDLFGKLKRAAEAAQADTQAGQAALDMARITVVAQVAGSYAESCHANRELAIARHSLDLQQRGMEVAQRLFDAGRGTRTDVTRARAQYDLLRASVPPLIARKKTAEYALAALLGNTPGELPAGVDGCQEAPALKQPIPVGDGMVLLQRRPDVREAERRLAAATARIGVAVADLYPDVRIGSSIGVDGLLADFADSPTQAWSIGPLISWTFPSESAHARVRAAQAGADATLAAFDETVLDALRDTQTALASYAQLLDQQTALHQSVAEARDAAAQNRQLYQGGRAPYLTSLDAERTLATAEASAAETDAQVSLAQIKLFLALGGGWQTAQASHAPAPQPAR